MRYGICVLPEKKKKKIESGFCFGLVHLYAYTGFNPVFKVSSHNVT